MVEHTNLVKSLFPVTPPLTIKRVGPKQKDHQKPRKKHRHRKPKDEVTLNETHNAVPEKEKVTSEPKKRGFEQELPKSAANAKENDIDKDQPRIDIHV
jgi:hypothetical protein